LVVEKAVALSYDRDDKAPRLKAKGRNLWARRMVEIAQQYEIPVLDDPGVSDALYQFEPESTIPEELYQAVAEIYRFVWQMREKR